MSQFAFFESLAILGPKQEHMETSPSDGRGFTDSVSSHRNTDLTFGSFSDAIVGPWDEQRQILHSLTEEQSLLEVVSKEEDASGIEIRFLLEGFIRRSTRDPSLHHLVVPVICDAVEISNTAEATEKKDGKWRFHFSKCWLILKMSEKKETHLFSIESSCRSPFVEYIKLAGIADPGTDTVPQELE